MTGRVGKHFRGDKDLIIHDKTGRVIYLHLLERPPVFFAVYKVVEFVRVAL